MLSLWLTVQLRTFHPDSVSLSDFPHHSLSWLPGFWHSFPFPFSGFVIRLPRLLSVQPQGISLTLDCDSYPINLSLSSRVPLTPHRCFPLEKTSSQLHLAFQLCYISLRLRYLPADYSLVCQTFSIFTYPSKYSYCQAVQFSLRHHHFSDFKLKHFPKFIMCQVLYLTSPLRPT